MQLDDYDMTCNSTQINMDSELTVVPDVQKQPNTIIATPCSREYNRMMAQYSTYIAHIEPKLDKRNKE